MNFLSAEEQSVFTELNNARTNPKAFAEHLKKYIPLFKGNILVIPGRINLRTKEGVDAVHDAIGRLLAQEPQRALTLSAGLSLACRDHINDVGASGKMGHTGADHSSPFERMNRYGEWQRVAGENIDYGSSSGLEVVISLLVDDGVPSRGHYKNIFNPNFGTVGVAMGPHASFDIMCVQDFAGGYVEKSGLKVSPSPTPRINASRTGPGYTRGNGEDAAQTIQKLARGNLGRNFVRMYRTDVSDVLAEQEVKNAFELESSVHAPNKGTKGEKGEHKADKSLSHLEPEKKEARPRATVLVLTSPAEYSQAEAALANVPDNFRSKYLKQIQSALQKSHTRVTVSVQPGKLTVLIASDCSKSTLSCSWS